MCEHPGPLAPNPGQGCNRSMRQDPLSADTATMHGTPATAAVLPPTVRGSFTQPQPSKLSGSLAQPAGLDMQSTPQHQGQGQQDSLLLPSSMPAQQTAQPVPSPSAVISTGAASAGSSKPKSAASRRLGSLSGSRPLAALGLVGQQAACNGFSHSSSTTNLSGDSTRLSNSFTLGMHAAASATAGAVRAAAGSSAPNIAAPLAGAAAATAPSTGSKSSGKRLRGLTAPMTPQGAKTLAIALPGPRALSGSGAGRPSRDGSMVVCSQNQREAPAMRLQGLAALYLPTPGPQQQQQPQPQPSPGGGTDASLQQRDQCQGGTCRLTGWPGTTSMHACNAQLREAAAVAIVQGSAGPVAAILQTAAGVNAQTASSVLDPAAAGGAGAASAQVPVPALSARVGPGSEVLSSSASYQQQQFLQQQDHLTSSTAPPATPAAVAAAAAAGPGAAPLSGIGLTSSLKRTWSESPAGNGPNSSSRSTLGPAAAAAAAGGTAGRRPLKRVRFNDAVQVFVLPPKADDADARGQGGAQADYQHQLQHAHGQWFQASAATRQLSRREAARLRREQAAAAAAAAAVAAVTGDAAAAAADSRAGSIPPALAPKQQQSAGEVLGGTGLSAASEAGQAASNGQPDCSTSSAPDSGSGSSGGNKKKQKKRIATYEYIGMAADTSAEGSAAAAAAAAAAGIEDALDPEAFTDPDMSFSPWHQPAVVHVNAQLLKESEEAKNVERMMREEEQLDESIVASIMTYMYKEIRAPSCQVLQSRIQRFKAVIAPYRKPSMLHWLRRNPRLLLMTASTLTNNISGILSVLTPGVMLPDAATELLGKCPQLVARTPGSIQVKVEFMKQLLGPSALVPLVAKLPVILTLSSARLQETVEVINTMVSDPGCFGVILAARVAADMAQQQGQQANTPAAVVAPAGGQESGLDHSAPAGASAQQAAVADGADATAGVVDAAAAGVVDAAAGGGDAGAAVAADGADTASGDTGTAAAATCGEADAAAGAAAGEAKAANAGTNAAAGGADAAGSAPAAAAAAAAEAAAGAALSAEIFPASSNGAKPMSSNSGEGHDAAHAATDAQEHEQEAVGELADKQQQQQTVRSVSAEVLAFVMSYPAIFINPTDRLRQRFNVFKHIVEQWLQHGGSFSPSVPVVPTAGAAAAPAAAAGSASVSAAAAVDAAADGKQPAGCASATAGTAAAVPAWVTQCGVLHCGLSTMMSPLMQSDLVFQLLEHRAEFLLSTQQQGSIRIWNVHGPHGKGFEERYPGFALWRQQHKGVPAAVTLGDEAGMEGSSSGRKLRKRRRKAQDTS